MMYRLHKKLWIHWVWTVKLFVYLILVIGVWLWWCKRWKIPDFIKPKWLIPAHVDPKPLTSASNVMGFDAWLYGNLLFNTWQFIDVLYYFVTFLQYFTLMLHKSVCVCIQRYSCSHVQALWRRRKRFVGRALSLDGVKWHCPAPISLPPGKEFV
jgi:hypothetical protein